MHRDGDHIISQLSQLRNSIPDQVDHVDSKGFYERRRKDLYLEWLRNKFIAGAEKQELVADAFDSVDSKIQDTKIIGLSSTLSELSNSLRNDLEPGRRFANSKIDWKLIPHWVVDSATYQPWKHRLTTILSQYDLTDDEKSNILPLDFVVKPCSRI